MSCFNEFVIHGGSVVHIFVEWTGETVSSPVLIIISKRETFCSHDSALAIIEDTSRDCRYNRIMNLTDYSFLKLVVQLKLMNLTDYSFLPNSLISMLTHISTTVVHI